MMDAALEEFYPNYIYSSFPNEEESFRRKFVLGTVITASVICLFGAVGNGIVLWLLGFCIKRNPFMVYILNLAVADLGTLLSIVLYTLDFFIFAYLSVLILSIILFLSLYSARQFLLMAISIDRCVAVFFPLWHRCHWSPRLSTIVCALIWVLSVLFTAITVTLGFIDRYRMPVVNTNWLTMNVMLCLRVVTIAAGVLFVKVCLKAQQHGRGKILTVVLLSLFFFLLFAFTLNVMEILSDHRYLPKYVQVCALLFACLSSSINPVIYFLVGRQCKSTRRESMKIILQKVFKEEEEGGVEETPAESRV